MYDETLSAAFVRLGCNPYLLAECLGSDWHVENDLITDGQPGGIYRYCGDEVFVIYRINWKEDYRCLWS